MTTRTVMAAWLGPGSQRSGPRNVYVCVPEGVTPRRERQLDVLLQDIVRQGDVLLSYPDSGGGDPVAAYAAAHRHERHPIVGFGMAPDLIVVVLDPLADSAAALEARALAQTANSDLLIAELPDLDG